MKALVLAGGKGSRLRPITHTSAKQLIPIANKPILFYGLEAIAACGIREVGIVVGETREEIQKAVGDGKQFGFSKVEYIHQKEGPLGLAHAVKIARPFLQDSPFLMYLGDNLLKQNLKPIAEAFLSQKPNAQILVTPVPNPQDFGVVELKNGQVLRLVEKPKNPPSNLALAGIYMFDSHIFEAIETLKPSGRGELEITDAIQTLIQKKFRVTVQTISGWWKDTGKLEDLLEANRLVLEMLEENSRPATFTQENSRLEGRIRIGEASRILGSTLRGPIVIGRNCLIRDSFIGPFTSVHDDAHIENSELEHSILMEHVVLKDVRRLQDSLVGQRVEICKAPNKPQAYRLMVGDSSRIEIP
ncbi:MAG: glucose-1-phosphate thymidylyltransferase [Elusimicrobia bacterium]|nr:glucose-1-phosphate thymidylyltransferase [Elusimicrobiota bacterium]